MKIFNPIFISIIFLLVVIGCVSPKQNISENQGNNKSLTTRKNAEITADEKKLTKNNTYFDVIKLMGTPDKEITSGPPDAKIPNTMLYYAEKNWMVFLAYDMPFKGTFDKRKTHYLGTKGLYPEIVLHASDPKYAVIIDAYKFQ